MRTLLIPLVTGLWLAADKPEPDAAKLDRERLHGVWKLVGAEQHGKSIFEKLADHDLRAIFEGDHLTIKNGPAAVHKGLTHQGTYQLDPRQKPKTVDVHYNKKLPPLKGIYSLEKDTLKVCFTILGKRPVEFTTVPKSLNVLMRFRRERPEPSSLGSVPDRSQEARRTAR